MQEAIDGWDTFSYVEDKGLQERNRTMTILSIMEKSLNKAGRITEAGKELILSYWKEVGATAELKRSVAIEAKKRGLL